MHSFEDFRQLGRYALTCPMWILAVSMFLTACSIGSTPIAETPVLELLPYRFDAGGLPTTGNDLPLTLADTLDASRAYGWVTPPESRFMRTTLTETRDSFTIDGVIGPAVGFFARVPDGLWNVTAFIEAGREDSSTISLTVNGQRQSLHWHAFAPNAEPRTAVQDIYRVFTGKTLAERNGITIQVAGGTEDVRLLGISLSPVVEPSTPYHTQLADELSTLGRYGTHLRLDHILALNKQPLDSLSERLEAHLAATGRDPFVEYWHEQLDLLVRAESDLRLMGWEWATEKTGMSIFGRFHQAVMLLDGLLGAGDAEEGPLYERALFQRGRLLYWLGKERGGRNEIAQGARDLADMYARVPDDSLLAMYNGERIDIPDPCDTLEPVEHAPEWSVGQHEALCRLRNEVHWWVTERQAPNGEFGGKIGDDVELFRWWPPVVLSGDTTAFRGWKRLADGVWVARKVYKGYSRRVIDVEHASEFIADTAPEMVLYSDDSTYVDRLRYSARYFEDLWTGFSPDGRRYFKSAWFSSTEVDTRPPRDRDLEMNTRAMKAVRYLAWKTRDPDVIRPLHEWSSAWAHAAMRTDKGKPRGIIPASIRLRDEAINGDEPTWYLANMYWDYFDWSGGTKMLDQLLFTSVLTGDSTLLEPMFASLELVRDYGSLQGEPSTQIPGSTEWAAHELQHDGSFWSVVESWRLGVDRTDFDDLLMEYGTPYTQYRLTGDEAYLRRGISRLLSTVRFNTPIRTTEVLHTDRVRTPGAMDVKAMLTGDGVHEGQSPYVAVSWEDTGVGFTALVANAGAEQLRVHLFSHDRTSTEPTMRLWQLSPGSYSLEMAGSDGTTKTSQLEVSKPGQRVGINLPPRELTTVTITARP